MRKMEVIVYRDREKKVNGFQVSGHSGYGEAGSDILCSAVSALTINCVNSIETLTHDRPSIQAVNEEEGFLHYRLETVSDEARLLLDSLVLGLKEIEKSYSRYLTIRFEEE